MKTKLERWARPRVGDTWSCAAPPPIHIVRSTKDRVYMQYGRTLCDVSLKEYRKLAAKSIIGGATFKPAK